MKRLFKWLLLLTAVLAVGMVVLVYNPGLVKGPLERYLSDIAGYSISLEGELKINPGRLSELTATNIRISAPDWASQRDLVSVGYLKVVLDTSSLFEDIVVIDTLQVDKLRLNLETRADGADNWLSANAPPSKDEDEEGEPVVSFDSIQINDTSLRYINGKKDVEHVLHITSLDQQQKSDHMLHITLDGDFNDRPIEFTGTIGPYANLLNRHDVAYTGSGHFGNLNISGRGLIDDLLKPRRPQFNLELQGPNIDEITAMLKVDDLGSGGFSLRARGDEVNDHYEAGINGKIGDIALDISASTSDLSQLDELDLKVSANGPSLGSFTRAFGIENWPDKPFRLKADVDRIGGTLNISDLNLSIGGTELVLDALLTNFPSLDASRVKLSITGDDVAQFRELLGVPGIATGAFEVYGKLDVSPQELELLQLEVKTSLGHFILSGTLGAAPTYIGSKLHLHLEGTSARTLMSAFNIDALPEQPFNLDTRIEIMEKGMLLDRGVLVSIDDDRLELGGFVAFSPGSKGTDIEMRVSGQNLAQMLRRLVGNTEVPERPYDVSGRVRVMEEGIELENVKAEYAEIELAVTGLISLADQLRGTGLDFQINGKNLSSLRNFTAIGDSLDIFVPGQSYQASGRFSIENNGWHLDDVSGRIGKTNLGFDGLISNKPEWSGTNFRFSVKGPDLNDLLARQDGAGLPSGVFESSGRVTLSDERLNINDFNFETTNAHGKIDLDLGWPVSSTVDARFNVNIRGDDIRHLLPRMEAFEPEMAAYKILAVGHKRGDLVSLKQFDASIGNLQVSLQGKVDEDPTDKNVDITFSAISSDLSTLGQLNGDRLPAMALDLKADFRGNARQFVLHNLTGALGQSHIGGTLNVSLEGPKPKIKLTAQSNYIDIRPFLELTDSNDEAATATDQARLIPATPLPLDAMAAADMSIRLNIVELRHQTDSIKNLYLEAELQAGSLNVPQLSFEGPRGKLKAAFSITPTGTNNADVKIDLSAEKIVLNLSGQSKDKLHQVPAADIDFRVNGKGSNLQEVAGSTNGSLYIGSNGGVLEGVNLNILDKFLLEEIFSLVMPKTDTQDDLDLSCAVAILKIKDGLVTTDPAVTFITSRITMVSKGTVDLKTEKMKLNFNAIPNNALQISAGELFNPYILVGGTLSTPVVGIDPTKALLHGGAAVGTAGISILAKGLLDRWSNTVPLCEQLLKKQAQQKQ